MNLTATFVPQSVSVNISDPSVEVSFPTSVPGDYVGSEVPRQAAKTVTPTNDYQTAVAVNTFTTGDIIVAPIPTEQYAWFGKGTEYVGTLFNKTINLSRGTTFDSWTASTTQGKILDASATADATQEISAGYTWWFVTTAIMNVVNSYSAPQRIVKKYYQEWIAPIYFYPSTNSQLIAGGGYSSCVSAGTLGRGGIRYYNIGGALDYYSTANVGPMFFSSAPSIQISGNTVTVKAPAAYARCDNIYFSTTSKSLVVSNRTNMQIKMALYKTPSPNDFMSKLVGDMRNYLTS